MSKVIVRQVKGSESEIGLGIFASIPPHVQVSWGEYADWGEADGELRVMGATDGEGNDITLKFAKFVADAIGVAIDEGNLTSGDIQSAVLKKLSGSGTEKTQEMLDKAFPMGLASQYEVDRHAEKQGVSYADAWRYFESQGYDMSTVWGQYEGPDPK